MPKIGDFFFKVKAKKVFSARNSQRIRIRILFCIVRSFEIFDQFFGFVPPTPTHGFFAKISTREKISLRCQRNLIYR